MDFWSRVKDGCALFDGAMGTYYTGKFGHEPEFCEQANILFPDRVLDIHREYIAAGCDAIKTNTFGANRYTMDCGAQGEAAVIDAGCRLAFEAVRDTDAAVFADVGPLPYVEGADRAAAYRALIDRFLQNGTENFLFETFSSEDNLTELCEYIKSKRPEARIICCFAVSPDGFTREGVPLSKLRAAMETCPAIDSYGLNCVCGAAHMEKLLASQSRHSKPLCAMPNAGYPTVVGSRIYFDDNAEYYAKQMTTLRGAGAAILGGCCGTTPEHIALTRAELSGGLRADTVTVSEDSAAEGRELENRFWSKLEAGERVITVELDPPANSDITKFMAGARELKSAGVDAITLADCPISRVRMDSSLLACKLKRELAIDPIPHMTCRDRNIVAAKALLFGLNSEGVNNVLVVTGDPVPTAERGVIKSVFSFNSAVLASYIRDLAPELHNGAFRVYGALNLNAVNFDSQLERARVKIESGVSAFFTQPVHSKRALENLKRARAELDTKLLGGVMPIVSYRNACYMNSEIAGITVSEEIVKRYEGLDREQATELAVDISTEIARQMADCVDGYYIMTPFTRTDIVRRLMENIRTF